MVVVLNSLYEAPQSSDRSENPNCFKCLGGKGAEAVEEESLRLLEVQVTRFLESLSSNKPKDTDWRQLLRSKKVGYGGEVVGKAQHLKLEQILTS